MLMTLLLFLGLLRLSPSPHQQTTYTEQNGEAKPSVLSLPSHSEAPFPSDSPIQRCCGGGEIDSVEAERSPLFSNFNL